MLTYGECSICSLQCDYLDAKKRAKRAFMNEVMHIEGTEIKFMVPEVQNL